MRKLIARLAGSKAARPTGNGSPMQRRQIMPLAMESRMLFDGAGFTTAEPIVWPATEFSTASPGEGTDAGTETDALVRSAQATTTAVHRNALLVIDSSTPDWSLLAGGLSPDSDLLILDNASDPFAQIAGAMSDTTYAAIHIVSHGQSEGRLILGDRVIDTDSLRDYADSLATIGSHLTEAGDILLYGCEIGAGPRAMAFVGALSQATSADVAASANITGNAASGGDWRLELSTGPIESRIPIDQQVLDAYQGSLPATPLVTLSDDGDVTLLGETFSVTATFANTGTSAGFGPYLDLFVPARGVDGAPSPDGVTITGANYLGSALTSQSITLTASDILAGTVSHPYFTDSAGNHLVSIPAGLQAGDQLIVYQLPFGSFTPGQPAAEITITGTLSNQADVGTSLNLIARGGYQYGNDATDNPATDPSIQGVANTLAIEPALYRLTTTYIGPEDETATGPNYARAYRIDVDLAEGQTLNALNLSTILPTGMQYLPISGTPTEISGYSIGTTPLAGWTNVNGVMLSMAGTDVATPGTTVPGGTVTRGISSSAGTSSEQDISMVVQFYVPYLDASSVNVIDPSTGNEAALTVGTSMSATWTPIDSRDPANQPITQTVANAHTLGAGSIQVQKSGSLIADTGGPGYTPGDTMRYTLNAQISDYFALGGNPGGTDLLITDTLSDGQLFLDSTTVPAGPNPILTVNRGGATETYTLSPSTNYTVTLNGSGQQVIVFNLRSALPSGGNGPLLIGDLFADAVIDGATTAQIQFDARLQDAYRVQSVDATGNPASGSELSVNEGDYVANAVRLNGTVLDADLDPLKPGLQDEADGSTVVYRVDSNAVSIMLTNINGVPPGPVPRVTPGDDVSYCLSYTLPSGDFENLVLSAYIPLPIFSASDPNADGTSDPFTLQGGGFTSAPSVSQYSIQAIGGDGTGVTAPSVTVDPVTNSLHFDFGDRQDLTNQPLTVQVCYTVRASSAPFADGLMLTTQANSSSSATHNAPISTNAITQVVVSEPLLKIYKGAVGDDVIEATSTFDPSYTPTAPSALIRPAGDLSANPLLGTVSSADVLSLNTDLSNVDQGDNVRFAIVLVNEGSSGKGAFDVRISDALPSHIDPATLDNLRVVRGDGTAVAYQRVGGGAATVADLFAGGIELVDTPASGPTPALGAIAGTHDLANNPVSPGQNVIIVTYDAKVLATASANQTAASSTTLSNYAGTEGGSDYSTTDLTEAATVTTAPVQISKRILGTSEASTGLVAGHEQVVIGEVITYEVVLSIPEGVVNSSVFTDTLDSNLSFASLVSATPSAGVTTSNPASGFITLTPTDAAPGTANRISFNFGTITNANTDNSVPETITLVYQAVVMDVTGNQAGTQQDNTATLTAQFIPSISATAPYVVVVEPALSMTLTPNASTADAGDTLTYTLVINSTGGSKAFDTAISSAIPAGLTYVAGSLTQTAGPVASSLAESAGAITGSWTEIAAGSNVTLTFQVTVDPSVTLGQTFNSTVDAEWSSLPGTATDLSSHVSSADQERTGAGGVDDYLASTNTTVRVNPTVTAELFLVETSSPATPGTSVTVGELVRYRMVMQLPEATAPDYRVPLNLPPTLSFVNDGTATLAFVSNSSSITSSTLSGAGLNQTGGGLLASDIASVPTRFVIPGSSIVDGTNTPLSVGVQAAGLDPVFSLGQLGNAESDANAEFVVIEFTAVLQNNASATPGASVPVQFTQTSNGDLFATSNTVTSTVVEPHITGMDKRVVSVVGNQVTYEVVFTNTGGAVAHDVALADDFVGALNQSFNGAASVSLVSVPGGTTNSSSATALDVRIPVLGIGESVTVRYSATINDTSVTTPSRDARVLYTSLEAGPVGGETLTVTTEGGTATSTTPGERTGNTADYGGAFNTYNVTDGAGLGHISGYLWDDTADYDGSLGVVDGDVPLEARTVSLTWAGVDGVFGNADDQTYTTTTDATGRYEMHTLPAGNYRISTAATFTDGTLGPVAVYQDSGTGSETDGVIALTLANGGSVINQDFTYVQINEAPTLTVGGARTVAEEALLTFTGVNQIVVADVDAGSSTSNRTVLSVANGTLSGSASGSAILTGSGTGTLTIEGSLTDINATLASLGYRSNTDYNGGDTLTITTNDRGNTGDADGDLIPGESIQDNLQAVRTVAISVTAINDAPVAVADTRTTDQNTSIAGQAITPSGVQITAGDATDTDPDLIYGDSLSVQGIVAGNVGGTQSANVGNPVAGAYGVITLNGNGSYTYVPGTAARALRTGDTVTDTFTYTIRDAAGLTSTTTLTITVNGLDDPPVAVADNRNTLQTTSATGQVITPSGAQIADGDATDTDPDLPDGDTLTVQGVAAGNIGGVQSANVGAAIIGSYGALTLNAIGTYSYVPNPSTASLPLGSSLTDVFTYTVTDASGQTSTTTLSLTINGTNDAVTATPDARSTTEDAPPISGNVVAGAGVLDGMPGDVADTDIDNDPLTVQGVQAGTTAGTLSTGVGTVVMGNYGSLQLNASGSYTYTQGPATQALTQGQVVTDVFSYTVTDSRGATATTMLTITITGTNDAPTAHPDTHSTAHTTAAIGQVITPSTAQLTAGDATDTDPDSPNGDTLTVQGVAVGNVGGIQTGNVGTAITGAHGSLTLNSDGTYSYQPNALAVALPPGSSVTDVFTYTVTDSQGATSTTTLTITTEGRSDPPEGTDKSFSVAEDTAQPLNAADFGFTDPDTGASLSGVRIDALPASGTLLLGATPVTPGQFIPVEQLSLLSYVPAADANLENLGALPSIAFSVRDNLGAYDPVPNQLTFQITPVNDPPTAPSMVTTVDGSATLNSALSELAGLADPTDPDVPVQTLTVRIDGLPGPIEGTFYRPDGVAVTPGMLLTPLQLQHLRFVPNPANPAEPNASNGLIPIAPLTYTVQDGHGGAAPGSIRINVRPIPPAQNPAAPLTPASPPPLAAAVPISFAPAFISAETLQDSSQTVGVRDIARSASPQAREAHAYNADAAEFLSVETHELATFSGKPIGAESTLNQTESLAFRPRLVSPGTEEADESNPKPKARLKTKPIRYPGRPLDKGELDRMSANLGFSARLKSLAPGFRAR